MSRKSMVLVLAMASVTLLALPAAASAQEIHLEGVTSASGTASATSIVAEGEPTITCESGHWILIFSSGGTTGSFTFHYTGCHTRDPIFGATIKCRTNSPGGLDNTVHIAATWHLTTLKEKPAVLITLETATISCAGVSSTVIHGNVIGTVTSPACGTESKTMTTMFAASGSTQEHSSYTGVSYDLTATTGEGGAAKTAGLTSTGTTESTTTGKLNCT